MTEPHIDTLWYGLQPVVTGLQAADRLPTTGHLYDARLEVVKDHLQRWGTRRNLGGIGPSGGERALLEAGAIARQNPGASFLAYELVKAYCAAIGDERLEGQAARRATEQLAKAEKELQKRRKRGQW
jgi:hypothetical protein